MISCLGPGFVFLMITNLENTPIGQYPIADINGVFFVIFVVFVLGYGFSAVFVGIFEMAMETILFCYLFDDGHQYLPECMQDEDLKRDMERKKEDDNANDAGEKGGESTGESKEKDNPENKE